MIQATGTITMSDGVTSFINPLLNIYHNNPTKGRPQTLAAQIAVVKTVEGQPVINTVMDVLLCEYNVSNPNFEDAQLYLKGQLETAFPTVTFEIV
jgi:hypothetical protein